MNTVTIIDTGAANLAAVRCAFERLGADVRITASATAVRSAERVVLPGVGAFGAAMRRLATNDLDSALYDRARAGRATLGICLGMQLLCRGSDESPGIEGLGLVPARVGRFPDDVRVPQMSWKPVADGHAWFANSYRLSSAPAGWRSVRATHGAPFVAALWREGITGLQFHPELSGAWGSRLLAAWLRDGRVDLADVDAPASPVRVIPCLDVRDGRVVKGVKFESLRDCGDPGELGAAYREQGADELCLLDVTATPDARRTAADTVAAVRRALDIPITVGGGVRTPDDAARLLGAGADKVAINTAAVEDPSRIDTMARRFGSQCVVASIDAAARADGTHEVVVRSGAEPTGLDAVAWARAAVERGAGEVLLTSRDRDGTGEGYDTGLLRAVSDAINVPVVASGGVGSTRQIPEGLAAGASAVLVASILHDGHAAIDDIKDEIERAGWETRRC